jgi:hypothetical protein
MEAGEESPKLTGDLRRLMGLYEGNPDAVSVADNCGDVVS